MDQKAYLKKFSHIVRWSLPKQDAEDAIADYAEILSQYPEADNSSLIENLGEPTQAAKMLIAPHAYHRWLAAFGVMLFCLLLPEWWLLKATFSRFPIVPLSILFLLGIATVFVWFTLWRSGEKTPLPKGLLPALMGVFAALAAACGIFAGLSAQIPSSIPRGMYGSAGHLTLCFAGTVGAVSGLIGLVKARISDRRWSALYLLGLTSLVECVLVSAILHSMTLDISPFSLWSFHAAEFGVIGVAGLVAMGKSLC